MFPTTTTTMDDKDAYGGISNKGDANIPLESLLIESIFHDDLVFFLNLDLSFSFLEPSVFSFVFNKGYNNQGS